MKIFWFFTGEDDSGRDSLDRAEHGRDVHHARQQSSVRGWAPPRHADGTGHHRHELLQRMHEKGICLRGLVE